MRRLTVLAGLAAVLLLAGCRPREITSGDTATAVKPTPDQLVAYVNANARLVQSVKSAEVQIDCKQAGDGVGLVGSLVCTKPRNFRLKADLLGKPAVDVGSNDDEFWYWITDRDRRADQPNYVYHCTYADMAEGKAKMPFPFQPDMVVAALGLGDADPNKTYTVKDDDPKTVSLVEETTSAQGQPVKKVIVFNRSRSAPGKPQVLAHVLLDAHGDEICRANVLDVQAVTVDHDARAVLPSRVQLIWKAQQLEMTMRLYDVQANTVDPAKAPRMFHREDLADKPSFNLARGPDVPSGYSQNDKAAGGPIRLIGAPPK
jgi:hypothetical protein